MSKQKFNVGDKVKISPSGSMRNWCDEMLGYIGKVGYISSYDPCNNLYFVGFDDNENYGYDGDRLELVDSVIDDTLDVQTCIDFLLSNGYKVTLEKL